MNIIQACKDENLFLPYLGEDLDTWQPWMTALRVLYGLHPRRWSRRSRELIERCTGRKVEHLPKNGFDTALFLTGRRSGKSRIAGVIGAYEAVLAGHESKLSPGETGVVPIISPTKQQSRIVAKYLRAVFDVPMLQGQVVSDTREVFELSNGTRIEILAGDFRSVRGYTSLCGILDEVAFHQLEAESKVKSDAELIAAIEPSLATTQGKLIAISSPYARMGWCYDQYKLNWGNDAGGTLVWNCPTRTMNPTLSQVFVDRKLQEDLQKAKSEYLGEFRDSIAAYIPRAVAESLVVKGRLCLMPDSQKRYFAFCDLSGGRNDAAALAIGHREDRTVVVDLAKQWKAPFNPHEIVYLMCDELRKFNIRRIVGDNYAASFVSESFRTNGIRYDKSDLNKSALYVELLPRLCSNEIELLDDETLVVQLASLERRTRSGGKDSIDHPQGGHDDLINAVAGVSFVVSKGRRSVGALV